VPPPPGAARVMDGAIQDGTTSAGPPHATGAPWMRWLLGAALVVMLVDGAYTALALHQGHAVVRFSTLIGILFLCFGIVKLAVALHAYLQPGAQSPFSDQRQETGTPALFRLWLAYKIIPGMLSLAVAAVLILHGVARLDAAVTVAPPAAAGPGLHASP
jgi:uncharacterized membrane protein HdeD (DUF308 family)